MEKISDVILRNSRAEQYLCAAKKNFIMEHTSSESSSRLVICHFSDMHGDVERFRNVLEMIEYYRPAFAVHTGDLVPWNTSDDYRYFYDMTASSEIPVYNTIGNHDTFHDAAVKTDQHQNDINTNRELYDMFVSPLKGITCSGTPYYYVDFEKEKLRMIALSPYDNECEEYCVRDKYAVLQRQADWLIETLESAQEQGYGVIIAAHEIAEPVKAGDNNYGFCQRYSPWGTPENNPHTQVVEDIVDAFLCGGEVKGNYGYPNVEETVTVDYKFKKGGEFICYLAGHRHGDYAGYLPKHPKQLCLWMTCSCCFPAGRYNFGEEASDLPRIPGTVSEDAVNFCVIDRKRRTVTIIRMGASVNDLLEERIAARFRY